MDHIENKYFIDEKAFEAIANDRNVRREVARRSHLMFFHMYFPHYVKYEIAEFQKDIFRITEDQSNKLACIIAFRGSGKSTLVTFSYSLWATLGIQQKKFVLIICQTQAQARQHMANLKYEAEHNALLKSDLGPFQEDAGTGEWAISSLVFKNTGARIMIASVDQSIRGIRHREYRPDLLILDDVEDMGSAKKMEGREKLFDWFTREIVPLGDIGTRTIIVGNLLHEDSLVMRLRRMIDANALKGIYRWFPFLDEFGQSLWPGKFDTKEKIHEMRQSVANEFAWRQEYLLEIISDSTRPIHPEWIQRYDAIPAPTQANRYRGTFTGIDLAISERDGADKTAMVSGRVFGWGKDMRIYILPNPVNEQLNFPVCLARAKALSASLDNGKLSTMFIEDNQYQKALPQMLQTEGYPAIGVQSLGDKRSRLTLTGPSVKDAVVLFPRTGCEELIMQMVGLGRENHDDLADAFSLLVLQVIRENHPYTPWRTPVEDPDMPKRFTDDDEPVGCGEFRHNPKYPITRGLQKMKF